MRLVAWALALTASSSLTSKKPFTHRVVVKHVPAWVPHERLLGDGAWQPEDGGLACDLTTRSACDLAARLRGVGLGGRKLEVVATPKLPRAAVRGARLEDARRWAGNKNIQHDFNIHLFARFRHTFLIV